MTEKNRDPGLGEEAESASGKKKPYLKPAYRSEQVFERMALSCGKISPTEFQCRFNRKNS
jgi:hypothetical protein